MIRLRTTRFITTLSIALCSIYTASGEQTWEDVRERVESAVVCVKNIVTPNRPFEPFKPAEQVGRAHGSGFIFSHTDARGKEHFYIGTNRHVIEDAFELVVALPDICGPHARFPVRLKRVYPKRDIAILEFTAEGEELFRNKLRDAAGFNGIIPTVTLGDSNELASGEEIMVVGYPLIHELKSSCGHISGITGKPVWNAEDFFLQISAATSGGNSGGPVFNKQGQVIGILTGSMTRGQNCNLIIPINHFINALDTLLSDDETIPTVLTSHLGIITQETDLSLLKAVGCEAESGVYINHVVAGSAAELAGIRAGDVLTKVAKEALDCDGYIKNIWGKKLTHYVPWPEALNQVRFGEIIPFSIDRNGTKYDFEIARPLTDTRVIRESFPCFESIPYLAFGGLVLQNVSQMHEELAVSDGKIANVDLYAYLSNPQHIDSHAVVISRVYVGSTAFYCEPLSRGTIITHVNGKRVRTLDDVAAACAATSMPYITITTHTGELCALSVSSILNGERELIRVHDYEAAPFLDNLKALV